MEEPDDLRVDRSGSGESELQVATEDVTDLAEDQLVEEGRGLVVLVPGVERVEQLGWKPADAFAELALVDGGDGLPCGPRVPSRLALVGVWHHTWRRDSVAVRAV